MSLLALDPQRLVEAQTLAARAWDITKPPSDPPFAECAHGFRERLIAETSDVMQGNGASTAFGLAVKTLLSPYPVTLPDGDERLLTPEHLAQLNKIMAPPDDPLLVKRTAPLPGSKAALKPAITTISPDSAATGDSVFDLVVNGEGFEKDSDVKWNDLVRPTTFINPNQITAAIPATDLLQAGGVKITVFTPQPGGGTSNSVAFTITPAAQRPTKLKRGNN